MARLTILCPDPLFFLHHTQVDRLWWTWQQREPATRLKEFHGPISDFRFPQENVSHVNTGTESSHGDILPMAGLAKARKVEDVMDTMAGLLCYTY